MKMMNLNLGISLFTSIICFLSISCKKDNIHLSKTHLEKQYYSDSIIEQKYSIVSYSYEIESDTVPAFSFIALNLSSDFMIKTRMAFLEERFRLDFAKQLDSALVFGIKENVKGKIRHINFEVWHNVNKSNAQKMIDSLNTVFDKPLYYKPPAEWQWFIYNDKVFFIDGYKAGVDSNLLREIKLKYERDTLFLNYILSKVKKI
ncbi:hypothetical protein U0010_10410 [Myroides odoratus]|nr:hypothetical protein [Myroides odoratus]WQD55937.1 hypothetical protein U0010_10410 [Myroides odoratus]